jgi:hypothetical protein
VEAQKSQKARCWPAWRRNMIFAGDMVVMRALRDLFEFDDSRWSCSRAAAVATVRWHSGVAFRV